MIFLHKSRTALRHASGYGVLSRTLSAAPAAAAEPLSRARARSATHVAAAPTPEDYLLPFDADMSSVYTQKVLNSSSSYLTHSLLDINTNGFVTCQELQSGLAAVGLRLTDDQIQQCLQKYDTDPKNGVFERNELAPLFDHLKLHVAVMECGKGAPEAVLRGVEAHSFFIQHGAVAGGRSVKSIQADQDLYERVKSVDSHYLTYGLFDKNSHGHITAGELKDGLATLADIDVTDEQMHQLVERYDDNLNGVFEPSELAPFFDDLKKYKSISRLLMADSYERVYGSCSKYLTYMSFEKTSNAFITREEFKDGLAKLGNKPGIVTRFDLTDDEMDEIMLRYDDNNNNVLEPEEVTHFLDDFFASGSIDGLLAMPSPSEVAEGKASSPLGCKPWSVSHKLMLYSSAYLTHALLDSNSHGYVVEGDLRAGLQAFGIRMSDIAFAALVERYDENKNGVFEREELEPLFDDLKIHTLLCGYP